MGKYIQQQDLERAITAQTVGELFRDPANLGQVDVAAIDDVIDRAEGEVDSYLIGYEVDLVRINGADRLLKGCALDFARCFSFERDPEYVRTYGEDPRGYALYKRAMDRMLRIQSAIQRLPDQTNAGKRKNVGGYSLSTGPRMITPSPEDIANLGGGTWNTGL